jgi:acetolactate synthase-1/2/3 large subunit
VQAFAEKTCIPVAMTLLGLGHLPASHVLNLGMMGMHGEAWVNKTIQEADLLLALGMRFDDRVTGTLKTYAPNAKKIHVDIDPAEINKNVKVDVALVGDLRKILLELLPRMESAKHTDGSSTFTASRAIRPFAIFRTARQRPSLRGARDQRSLARNAGEGNDHRHRRRPAPDVGGAILQARAPALADHFGRLGTMGFALPAAIGAKVARPDADVWVVVGDGGFQMTMAELATIVQENLKVNIAIINNGYLGMVRQWQEFFYERNYEATPLLNPNFVKLGQAYRHPQHR